MKLQHRLGVPASRDRVWVELQDLPGVASCVPGVEEMVGAGEGRYDGRLKVAVGPVRLALAGVIELVSSDEAAGRITLRAEGSDNRLGGGVRALVDLSLVEAGAGVTELVVDSDIQVLGRLGVLGQPIMKRKADEVMRAFAACLAARLA